ncbi:MAG: SDR family oxidoreductase [Oceanococcus sp.]|nr:MAG: SDR family oxidoreductase [Oceanococcus sp.]
MSRAAAILITGGGTGLGAASARILASEGWRVGLLGRRLDRLEAVAADIRSAGGDVQIYPQCVSQAAAVASAIGDFKPSAVLNAAAVLGQGDIIDALGPAEFAEVQAINVNGTFNTCCAAMRQWQAAGHSGDIVNVSSLAGIRGMQAFPGFSAYAASKHAIVGLTEALAKDGKAHDIRVNAIAPGMMRTDMLAQMGIHPKTLPEDIVPTVRYLLDRSLSGPLSGTTIEIHSNDD